MLLVKTRSRFYSTETATPNPLLPTGAQRRWIYTHETPPSTPSRPFPTLRISLEPRQRQLHHMPAKSNIRNTRHAKP